MKTRMRENLRGFTLIEVAVVLLILGFILAASLTPLSAQIERSKIKETDAILKDVMESLYGYAATFGRLPCPATANSGGTESVGGTDCATPNVSAAIGAHGFVPGRTLGLSGEYNADGLLLDAWGNPIRYSVTQNDTFNPPANIGNNGADFTGNEDLRAVISNGVEPEPDLLVCGATGGTVVIGTVESCQNGGTLANNAVAVIFSLGKDGHEATTALGVNGADQIENSGEQTMPAGPSGVSYRIAINRVFVFHDYKETTTGNGVFNDQIIWMSPFTLYERMYQSKALP